MDWTAAIDIYCERTSPGFWAEPVNAWSNLGFPVAAFWAAMAAWRRGGTTNEYWTIVVLGALVGVGSFLFHTFANVWAEYADTIPIWTFVAAAVAVAARRIAGLRPGPGVIIGLVAAVLFIVLFVTATDPEPAAVSRADPLNGSGQYAPALVLLGILAGFAWVKQLLTRDTGVSCGAFLPVDRHQGLRCVSAWNALPLAPVERAGGGADPEDDADDRRAPTPVTV
jgi:hypothetical protein